MTNEIKTSSIRVLEEDKKYIKKIAKQNGKLQYWIIHEALETYKEKENESRSKTGN